MRSIKVGDKVIGKRKKLYSSKGVGYDIFNPNYVRVIAEIKNDSVRLKGDSELYFYINDFELYEKPSEKKMNLNYEIF